MMRDIEKEVRERVGQVTKKEAKEKERERERGDREDIKKK